MTLSDVVETRLFTRADFHRLIETGIVADDEHVELLHGKLIVVPPQGPPHSYSSTLVRDRLLSVYAARPGGAVVREDKPLDCGEYELPEPDLVVVRGTLADYAARDPRGDEAILVVEISRTTQLVDRDKASIYARAKVPLYWLIDLSARRVEVYRSPTSDGRYGLVHVCGLAEELEVPETGEKWRVVEVLPPE